MELIISNQEEVSGWLAEQGLRGRDVRAVKCPPPPGATYDCGTPITQPVNCAWYIQGARLVPATADVVFIQYEGYKLTRIKGEWCYTHAHP